jgi:hypothetical protein
MLRTGFELKAGFWTCDLLPAVKGGCFMLRKQRYLRNGKDKMACQDFRHIIVAIPKYERLPVCMSVLPVSTL